MWTLLCRIPLAPASMYWCAPGGTQDYINVMHCWQASLSLTTLAQELQQEGIEYYKLRVPFYSEKNKSASPVPAFRHDCALPGFHGGWTWDLFQCCSDSEFATRKRIETNYNAVRAVHIVGLTLRRWTDVPEKDYASTALSGILSGNLRLQWKIIIFSGFFPSNIVIFPSYVSHYQRVIIYAGASCVLQDFAIWPGFIGGFIWGHQHLRPCHPPLWFRQWPWWPAQNNDILAFWATKKHSGLLNMCSSILWGSTVVFLGESHEIPSWSYDASPTT